MADSPYLYLQPDQVTRLANLNILARQAVEGFITGLHQSPHHGFSAEFSEHRQYTAGDDLRHMDWVAWARSDRYYIKQYEQQTNLRAHILLDVSQSMNYSGDGEVTKFQYGCFLTACLSYLMTRQQDMVALAAFDDKMQLRLPPASTPAHLDRLFRGLEQLRPGKAARMAETMHELARTIAKRGLIIVISDLYDEPANVMRALQHFVHKKHQIIVFHVLDRAELELPFKDITSFVDLETNEQIQADPRYIRQAYRRAIDEFVANYRKECSDRNIEYVLTPTDTPYDRMLLNYLTRRKAMRR